MINIEVFSEKYVEVESDVFNINSQDDMVKLIKHILDKAYYAGEKLYLGKVHQDVEQGKNLYEEIERW